MKNRTILLVEDNPDDVTLTLRAFKSAKLANQVVVVNDGAEALDYLLGRGAYANRDLGQRPALVLLDLKLPKVDGLEVLRQLRAHEQYRLQPVVILTSSREELDIVRSYQLGCNSYVRKPVNFDEFLNAANQVGLYWLLLNEIPSNG